MSVVQDFVAVLKAELERTFTPHGFTVEAREPVESEVGEGENGPGQKEIFISTGGFSFPEGIADMGETTRLTVPVLVSTVMGFPRSEAATAAVLARRLSVVRAIQRAVRDFSLSAPGHLLSVVPDANTPENIEGYYVDLIGILVEFDLPCEEAS